MTGPRPTVIHVTTTDMSLELLLGPQLEAMARAGYDVVGASAPGPYVEALTRRGIPHVALAHATRAMAPAEDGRALLELLRLFRERRPAIVHTHNPKPGLYGRLAARLARVPVVVNTVHGLYAVPEDPWPKRAVVYGLERMAAACSDAELLQNPEDLPTLRRLRVPAERLTVLGNGIDLQRFDPGAVTAGDRAAARADLGATQDDDVVVGLVGRLVRPDEPDKADALTATDRATAERAGVRLLGAREDVVPLYAAMDVHVLASHREGFPRSPMEASAMGVPVVATDVRGCRQAVEHGCTGILVPPRDPGALATAIERLAGDPAERRRFGAAAREKALRDFDQQRCVATTLHTYERLLRRAGQPAPVPS
jgi:glycosyltransferase involved in cell wall biosynthesis